MAWEWALPFISLSTTCKSGEKRTFEVRAEGVADREGDSWFYYAKPGGAKLQEDEEYFASFKRITADLLQLEGVKNGLPSEYHGCGITRALIVEVARHHATRIRSSRHRPLEEETRTEAATAVWRGMVRDDLASMTRLRIGSIIRNHQRVPPNKRLKLTAPVVYGRIAFVKIPMWRRSLGAPR